MVAAGQERVERRLLERDADQRAHLRPVLDDVVARRREPCPTVGGSSVVRTWTVVDLPGAVRPEEAVDLAGGDGEVDPVDRAWALPVLADETLDLDPVRRLHRSTLPTGRRPPRASGQRLERELRRDDRLAVPLVGDVHGVVLPVGARDRRPTSTSQRQNPSFPSVRSSSVEDERPPFDLEVGSLHLRHTVDEHLEGRATSPGSRTRVPVRGPSDTFIEWQPVRAKLVVLCGLLLAVAALRRCSPRPPRSRRTAASRRSLPSRRTPSGIQRQLRLRLDLRPRDLRPRRGPADRVRRPLPTAREARRFEDGAPIHGSTRLELVWTTLPVVVLFLIAHSSSSSSRGSRTYPTAGAQATGSRSASTGRQFYWQFEYPNGVIAIDQMRAPAGVPVRLRSRRRTTTSSTRGGSRRSAGRSTRFPGTGEPDLVRGGATRGSTRVSAPSSAALEHANMLASGRGHAAGRVRRLARPRAAPSRARRAPSSARSSGRCLRQVPRPCRRGRDRADSSPGSATLARPATRSRPSSATGVARCPPVGSGWTSEQIDALTSYLQENPPGWQLEQSRQPSRLAARQVRELARHHGPQADRDPLHLDGARLLRARRAHGGRLPAPAHAGERRACSAPTATTS